MINTDKMITIRRRITDKLCKDSTFLAQVAGLAIEEGAIKHTDILNTTEIFTILDAPPLKK